MSTQSQQNEEVQNVTIHFEISCESRPLSPEEMCVLVGSHPAVGNWDIRKGVQMQPAKQINHYNASVTFSFNMESWIIHSTDSSETEFFQLEYKFVILNSEKPLEKEWEGHSHHDNRVFHFDKNSLFHEVLCEWNSNLPEKEHKGYQEFKKYLEWNAITSTLLVGTCPRTLTDLNQLAEAKVTAVLNLQETRDIAENSPLLCNHLKHHYHSRSIVYSHFPIRDFDGGARVDALADVVCVLKGLVEAGHKVYVHCTAGIGRSASAVCAYLVFVQGMNVYAAERLLKDKRPKVYIKPEEIIEAQEDYALKYTTPNPC